MYVCVYVLRSNICSLYSALTLRVCSDEQREGERKRETKNGREGMRERHERERMGERERERENESETARE
jgi:hypothetical protein